MLIGIPKEIKNNENRVAITPAGVDAMVRNGHSVFVEKSAGIGSGISDEAYEKAGASIVADPVTIYGMADMIMKVKEPLESEYGMFTKPGQILFTYLHLAAVPKLADVLVKQNIVSIAYETVQLSNNSLPLLTPMSEVAGRMSIQIGCHYLEKPFGGKGVLLGGVPSVQVGHIVIIGGGVVGTNAAKRAVGMGAKVTILDVNLDRLRQLDDIFGHSVQTLASNSYNIAEAVKSADLLIGGVLIPGAKAPRLVTEEMVKTMQPGSVIVDVAIDQGGCIETIDRVTTHSDPIFVKHGVVHYSVANIPGCVASTSTFALTNATLPYAVSIANKGWIKAIKDDAALAKGVNIVNGKCTYKAVGEALGFEYMELDQAVKQEAVQQTLASA